MKLIDRARVTEALWGAFFDDAALFPPQGDTLSAALRAHAENGTGRFAAFRGMFVLPASRLNELLDVRASNGDELHLSLITDLSDVGATLRTVETARAKCTDRNVTPAAIEIRLPSANISVEQLRQSCRAISTLSPIHRPLDLYFESTQMASPDEAQLLAAQLKELQAVIPASVGAKLRTGGLTADAVPASAAVAHFIIAMRDQGLSWKATAGLHHPVRGRHGGWTMHGFLNLILAAAGAYARQLDFAGLVDILEDSDAGNFRQTDSSFGWRDMDYDIATIASLRKAAFRSIGSCSFNEPLDGLCALGFLP